MAVSKVILNGDTLIDVTQKTVNSGNLLYGETALKNDGTGVTGSIATKTASDLSASGDTVSVPAGYYASSASKAVASGTEGTPVATKGTVSSHSVTVTPSVTNVAGYISGGSKTGTAVTVSASELVSGTKSITANGTNIDVTDYESVDVAVPSSQPVLQEKTATPSTDTIVVTPDQGSSPMDTIPSGTVGEKSGDNDMFPFPGGYSQFTVGEVYHIKGEIEFPNGGYVSFDSDFEYGGSTDIPFTVTGVTGITRVWNISNIIVVSYATGGYLGSTAKGDINVYETPYEPVAYDGLSKVTVLPMPSGTAGTPIATKGTVSNHSIAVTPSVTNTTGYITGSTISGTAATVSASELVSGTKSITSNGTNIDVTDYAAVDVSVSGGVTVDSLNVTSNGTYTAETGHAYSPVTVNVGGEDPDAVLFYDYDGTVLHRYSKTEFNALTEMPANPTHTGLTSQGWNWSLSDAKAHLVNHSQLDIGQCYITSDGATRFYITLGANDLDLGFKLTTSTADALTIDWGDGSTPDVIGRVNGEIINHTYSTTGDYIIEATCTSGSWYPIPYSATNSQSMRPFFGNDKKEILTGVMLGNNLNGSGTGYAGIAFGGNTNLEFVTIPTYYITSQTTYEFLGCGKLKQLTLPYGRTRIQSYAFYQCFALKSVSIPNTVTSIEMSAFYYTVSLERLPFPDSITSIATNNFQYSVSLKKFELPTSITSYSGSLSYNGYITSVSIPSTVTTYGASFSYCERLESVALPSGVTQTGSYSSCYNIKSFTIPSTVTTISSSAFSGCYGLTSLTIPSGVTTINNSAFYNCYQLRSLSIPSGVSNLETNTFSGCYMLESIELPSGIKIADNKNSIFSNCYNLKSVSVGFSGTTIPTSTFSNCYSLESFTIPNTIETIKQSAFSYCYSLKTITIPSSVTSIESYAFSYCYSMQEIHLLPTDPPTLANSNAFSNIPSDCVFYVPSASLDAYKTASNWSTYASKMVGE